MSKTLYEIIGVNKDSDLKTIESKCLELGKKYNPQNNPDDLESAILYKDILTAYSVLRNSEKRAEYDAQLKQIMPVIMTVETISTPTSPVFKNSINCIDCGSYNVQRLSLIHSNGITNVDLNSKGTSIGIGGAHIIGGGNALGVGLSKNKNKINGIQQTELSKLAKLPEDAVLVGAQLPTSQWAVGAAGLAAFGIFAAFDNKFTILSFIVASVVTLIVFVTINGLFADKKDKQAVALKIQTHAIQNQDAQTKWKNSFMCLACGTVYETQADATIRSEQTQSKLDVIRMSAR